MKKLFCVVFVALGIPAFAGEINAPEVTITTLSPTQTVASGSLRGANYSSDSNQSISCQVSRTVSRYGSKTRGSCSAVDSAHNQLSCYTQDSEMLKIIASINSASVVTFVTDTSLPTSMNCSSLVVVNSSTTL